MRALSGTKRGGLEQLSENGRVSLGRAAEQVLDHDHADGVVQRAPDDREAGAAMGHGAGQHLVGWCVEIQGQDPGAGHHDGADGRVRELEHPVHQVTLPVLEDSVGRALTISPLAGVPIRARGSSAAGLRERREKSIMLIWPLESAGLVRRDAMRRAAPASRTRAARLRGRDAGPANRPLTGVSL